MIVVKVKFTHDLDSHHDSDSSEPAPDVGDFSTLPNGDDLEVGEMPNPDADGKVMAYEEVWRQLDWSAGIQPGSINWVLESTDGEGSLPGFKVFYAKLGRFFLAVSKTSERQNAVFSALRQDLDTSLGKWKSLYEIGDMSNLVKIDSQDDGLQSDKSWTVGQVVLVGKIRYVVRALSGDGF
jgi:hypothetical protein